jgi:G3E family GTPase
MGYLGSGKTTFIQAYLNSPVGSGEKIILIINDFGQVNYDAMSMDEKQLEIKAITYGCLCCDLKIRFGEILKECGVRKDIDRILIEPSGILIPDVITDIFTDQSISKNLILEPLIHIVDVSLFIRIYKKLPPFIERQIIMSEKIVLNRIDKVSEYELNDVKKALIDINPNAEYFNFYKSKNADNILTKSKKHTGIDSVADEDAFFGSHNFTSVQIEEGLEFENRAEAHEFFINKGIHLERAKGIVSIKQSLFFVNYTKTGFSLSPWTKPTVHGISMIFSED